MRTSHVVALAIAALLTGCSGGRRGEQDALLPDTLDHDAAARFVGSWHGIVTVTLGGRSADVPAVLEVAAAGRNLLSFPGLCDGGAPPAARVTSDERFQAAGHGCPLQTDDGCTVSWSIRGGEGVRAYGPQLTLELDGRASGCGVAGRMTFHFASFGRAGTSLTLPHEVQDAQYSAALDRIVMTDAATRALWLLDPATGREQVVALPAAPTCLGLSPDGSRALVGHERSITEVDLAAPRVTITIPTDVTPVACTLGDAWAYLSAVSEFGVDGLRSIDLAGGIEHVERRGYNFGAAALGADGRTLYAQSAWGVPGHLAVFDVAAGTAAYQRDVQETSFVEASRLWIDRDGARLFTSAGEVYLVSPTEPSLPAYAGTLPNGPFTSLSAIDGDAVVTMGERLQVFEPASLAPRGFIHLPLWVTGDSYRYLTSRFVFHAAAGLRRYVLVQAVGLGTKGWALLTLDDDQPLDPPPGDHGAPFAFASAPANASPGHAVTLDAGTSVDPDGRALTYAWAITQEPGPGDAYLSDPASTVATFTAARDGEYAIELTVTADDGEQAMAEVTVTVTSGLPALGHDVSAADYSRGLDRLVMVDDDTSLLYLLDPETGEETTVALPAAPRCLAVGPDGLSAVVGHAGAVSLVDLAQARLVKAFAVDLSPGACVLAGNGWAHLFPPYYTVISRIHSVDLSTEQVVVVDDPPIRDGGVGRLVPGRDRMYTTGWSSGALERWDLSAGPARREWVKPWDSPSVFGFWLAADGRRIYTGGGRWLTAADAQEDDMRAGGALSGVDGVKHLATSPAEVAVIPSADDVFGEDHDTFLELFEPERLGHVDRLPLPVWMVDGQPYATRGRYVFYRSDGTRKYVVVERDGGAPGARTAVVAF